MPTGLIAYASQSSWRPFFRVATSLGSWKVTGLAAGSLQCRFVSEGSENTGRRVVGQLVPWWGFPRTRRFALGKKNPRLDWERKNRSAAIVATSGAFNSSGERARTFGGPSSEVLSQSGRRAARFAL